MLADCEADGLPAAAEGLILADTEGLIEAEIEAEGPGINATIAYAS